MRIETEIGKKVNERSRKKRLRILTLSLCAVIAGATSYMLINPAETAQSEVYCGHEEHVHDDTCYALKPATPSKAKKLTPSELTPSDYYVPDYRRLICGLPEHEHTLQCFSDPKADVETESVWERMFENLELTGHFDEDVLSVAETQTGYAESTRNYRVQEDGETMKGYTRYGAWYGDAYGDWDALFCAFCLHYAGVPEELMPFDPSCQKWTELLSEPKYDLYRPAEGYIPAPGDIVFFDSDTFDPVYPENREADHVGFVSELIYDEETGEPAGIKTIEGVPGDSVRDDNTYDLTDTAITGYGKLAQNPLFFTTIESAPASDGAVAVITGNLPDGATALIEAVTLSEEELTAYFGENQSSMMKDHVAYDIKIMVDGAEWQPDNTVSVTVRQTRLSAEGGEKFGVAHVDSVTNEVSDIKGTTDEDGELSFHTDGFSLYIFYTFTVDFHYGDITYSIPGMDSILLSKLFSELYIEADAGEAVSVTFSSPALLNVKETEDFDWLLTSLKMFDTEETLTVTFADGTELVIDVTDAQTTTDSIWEIVTSVDDFTEDGVYAILYGNQYAFGVNGSDAIRTSVTRTSATGGYKLSAGNSGLSEASQWKIVKTGSDTVTVQNIGNGKKLRLSNSTWISDTTENTTVAYSGGYWTLRNGNYYLRYNKGFTRSNSTSSTGNRNMTIYRLKPTDIVWCYHDGDNAPYAKYATLHDATTGNSALRDGDTLELHGNTRETTQTVIQKSITVKSADGEKYTADFVTTGGYFIYEAFPCDRHPDPNVGAWTALATRDCITVCPATFGTELTVLFKDIILDGFDAYHRDGDINDYHILQTIHNVELTLSGVTIQNYNIESGLNSNGAVSLDGRTTCTAPSQYGNRIILKDGSVMKNCNSYQGSPYSTGGFMVNSAYLELNDATIEDCSSRNGPAIVVDNNSTAYLREGALIQNCHAQEEGGAVRNSGVLYIEEGSTVKNCGPQSGYEGTLKGGAVYNKGTLYVSGGAMTGNTAAKDPKTYGAVSATLGSGIYQGGTMYLSGAPEYGADQDVYLPEGHVIIKNGAITAADRIPVVLEDEPRFRDILVSKSGDACTVSEGDLSKFDVKLSTGAVTDVDGKKKLLAAVYNAEGLDSPGSGDTKNVLELDVSEILVVTKTWTGDGAGTAHDPVTVQLYKNGTETPVDSLTLSSENNWTGTFTNIEVAQDGSVPYHLNEVGVDGYVTSVGTIEKVGGNGLPEYHAVNVTNTKLERTSLTVNKVWSDGNTSHDPVTVYLYDKETNQKVDEAELSSAGGWKHTFTELIKPADGQPLGYYLIEDFVPGYVSVPGEITKVEAGHSYWMPVESNQFSAGQDYLLYSNGYVIERNNTGLRTANVTRGMEMGGVNYPTYISEDEVSAVEATAVWHAESYSGAYAIKNGSYYLTYKKDSPGWQLSATRGTVTMYNSRLRLYSKDSNSYINVGSGGSLSYKTSYSNASAFTLYIKKTYTAEAEGYETTLSNLKVSPRPGPEAKPPEVSKKIDYLGDGAENPDTGLSGENDYRLYLDIDNIGIKDGGTDLLLILDCTTSMCDNYNMDGDFPVTHMDEILNGSYGPGVTRLSSGLTGNVRSSTTGNYNRASEYEREKDGLIYQFLNANENNRVGVVAFAPWKGNNANISTSAAGYYSNQFIGRNVGTEIRTDGWVTKTELLNGRTDDPKNYYIDAGFTGSGTNYEAGYRKAQELLEDRDGNRPVIMVFMTDGAPNRYIDNKGNDATGNETTCNREGYTLGASLVRDYNITSTSVVAVGDAASKEALLTEHANAIGGRFYPADNADAMRESMFRAVGLIGYAPLSITDRLSENVEFASAADLKITMEEEGKEEKELWNELGAAPGNMSEGYPVVTAVERTADGIVVRFNPSMKLLPLKKITVSYNVTVSQKAKDAYSKNRTYPHTGDEGTDYPENNTSSLLPGFRSNEQAQVVYRDSFDQFEETCRHPVVQVVKDPVTPKKPPVIKYGTLDSKVAAGKQIDYLGDNAGVDGMEELYRLYLELEAEEQPMDLLLVIDQSASMSNNLAGDEPSSGEKSRQEILLDFLNGEEQQDGSYNGFIHKFLEANENNDLAVLTFSGDSSSGRCKKQWGDKDDHISLEAPSGATNYTAAYYMANQIFAEKAASRSLKVMIFLSDGEPTLAYSDGRMQRSFAEDNLVGSMTTYAIYSVVDLLAGYMNKANTDAPSGSTDNRKSWLDSLITSSYGIEDDDGNEWNKWSRYVSYNTEGETYNNGYDVDFPLMYDLASYRLDVPGISSMYGAFTESSGSTFANWYNNSWKNWNTHERYEWMKQNTAYPGDSYDLFWLTEWAYSEFAEANPGVLTYTIGYSESTNGKYGPEPQQGEEDSRREKVEVLKYMAGEGRFYSCDTAEELADTVNSIALLKDIHMTDKLSEYVEFADEAAPEITLKDEAYRSFYESGKEFAYLYRNGAFTELGIELLDVSETSVDRTAGTVDIVFSKDAGFNADMKIEASFNVQLTEKAYEDWKKYEDYNGTKGDAGTDYGDNATSSEKPGFWSNVNESAKAFWNRGGSHSENLPKPVVQVPPLSDIKLKKIDAGGDFSVLSGAELDLYRELPREKTGCIEYTDGSGEKHYLLKINSAPLVSAKNTPIEVKDLRVGRYYLFETKAPAGYMQLEAPVIFRLGSGEISTDDENASVNADVDKLLLNVKNRSGYELPYTGGSGRIPITLAGLAVMLGTLMYGFIMRRRRERRYE